MTRSTGGKNGKPASSERRKEFTAAVRYRDGHKELLHVRNVRDILEARQFIHTELSNINVILIALHSPVT